MPRVSRFVSTVMSVLLCVSRARGHGEAEEVSPEARERSERLLNVFTVVKFLNDACNATGGNYYGTCFTATECSALGRICLTIFLAPIGAQRVNLSVCPCVCLSGTSLSRAVNLHLSRSESYQDTQRAIR